MTPSPLVSIVTVVRNAVEEIENTFRSVEKLKTPAVEYLIIDGGSTDGTLSLIERYAHIADYTHSRPDRGIYDAMNVGIQHAKGHFVLHLNAGDQLLSLPLAELETAAREGCDLVCYPVLSEHNVPLRPHWDKRLRFYNTLPHQGVFYRRTLLSEHLYDLRYRVYADFNLNQQLLRSQSVVKIGKFPIAIHDHNGISNNPKYSAEIFQIVKTNFGWWAMFLSWLHFKKEGIRHRLGITAR